MVDKVSAINAVIDTVDLVAHNGAISLRVLAKIHTGKLVELVGGAPPQIPLMALPEVVESLQNIAGATSLSDMRGKYVRIGVADGRVIAKHIMLEEFVFDLHDIVYRYENKTNGDIHSQQILNGDSDGEEPEQTSTAP